MGHIGPVQVIKNEWFCAKLLPTENPRANLGRIASKKKRSREAVSRHNAT